MNTTQTKNTSVQIGDKVYHNFKLPSFSWDWENNKSAINEKGAEASCNGLILVFDIDAYRSYNSIDATHYSPSEHEVSYNYISIDNIELWDEDGNEISATEKEIKCIIEVIKEAIK
jgi:hypothetical protein